MRLNGAEIVLNCLKEENVDTVFGYPGGAVVPLYDELYKMNGEINHVRCAHEQGCVHAADGYARSTGNVGVCFVTSGPGATNAVTGIAAAYMDSVPLVVISGQVTTSLLGKDSFQEIDITGVTMTLTKHNYLVKDITKLPEIMKEAFNIAQNGRPGPVLIDIPKNIFLEETEIDSNQIQDKQIIIDKITDADIDKAAHIINSSNKPVIYAGGGVIISDASKELIVFAKKSGIPVVNTLMGLGNYPRSDELSLGMAGMHGFREANLAVKNSDLIIGIGTRFSDRGIGKSDHYNFTKIIHIDVDNTEINKNMKCDISFIGDMKHIIGKLSDKIKFRDRTEWIRKIKNWSVKDKINESDFVAKNILNKIQEYYKKDTIVTTDVGQHQMWVAQYWEFEKSRTFLTSGGLGAMGYGLGAALGAKLGNPDKDVILVTGDGSFRMNCNEMSTSTKYNLPVVIIMFNNNSLGLVRQLQTHFAGSRYSQTDMTQDVDYMVLAQAYGFKGYQVNNMNDLERALNEVASLSKKSVVIECIIDKEELVLPIVPPGSPINNQII
ncbi:biosynthetic-type acetolactate synthase large subunit [Abyssisolibacter fermentans]|uniref:biosynthetic-type acetolactate synthase large subunit n=1 Tax=Abyssisolibacter fermentans TaxID=1766203 RepID=UPI00082B843E|nr:biosynthetic-type acetolactate synthase large subunit [Abyssisolibacter fermentans]